MLKILCRSITPFTQDGSIDEDGLRAHALRLAKHGLGVCLANSSLGEGFTLSADEMRRVYEIVGEICAHRVPIYANPPEQHDARQAIRHAELAATSGCDGVVLYPVAGWHGFKPTEEESAAFLDSVLGAASIPVLIAANPVLGYVPHPNVIARAIDKHGNVAGVTINGDERYLASVRQNASRPVDYYAQLNGFLSSYATGATGLFAYEANIIPATFAQFAAACQHWDFDAIERIGKQLLAFRQVIQRLGPGNVKPVKMVLRLLKLPGSAGGTRPPNLMPAGGWEEALAADLRKIGLPELNEMIGAAGLARAG